MDLTSLPEEMLANILKYRNYEDIYQLRKINSFVELTTKTHCNLKRIPIEILKITGDFEDDRFCDMTAHFDPKFSVCHGFPVVVNECTLKHEIKESPDTLIEFCRKITNVDDLQISGVDLGNTFMSAIKANKVAFRKCTYLKLHDSIIAYSKESMKKLLEMLPSLISISITTNKTENDNSKMILNAEVLGDRQWRHIYFEPSGTIWYHQLDDAFLMYIASNCQRFEASSLKTKTSFTFEGVVNMLRDILLRGLLHRNIKLWVVKLGFIQFADVEPILHSIDGVNKCTCDEMTPGVLSCTVNFSEQTSYLTFTVVNPTIGRGRRVRE